MEIRQTAYVALGCSSVTGVGTALMPAPVPALAGAAGTLFSKHSVPVGLSL